jgi:hypothetical protein
MELCQGIIKQLALKEAEDNHNILLLLSYWSNMDKVEIHVEEN